MVATQAQTAPSDTSSFRQPLGPWHRLLRRWWSIAAVAICASFTAMPVALWLTPGQDVIVAGQHIEVGAKPPDWSPVGPAQVVRIGNTKFDIPNLRVYGPVRPRFTMGPFDRDQAATAIKGKSAPDILHHTTRALGFGELRWAAYGLLIAAVTTLGVTTLGIVVYLMLTNRRLSRRSGDQAAFLETFQHTWQEAKHWIVRVVAVAMITIVVVWLAALGAAYLGTRSLGHPKSATDLFGSYHLSPAAAGPTVYGLEGAVIGDSRAARVGGPPVTHSAIDGRSQPTADDRDCNRSSDSLAAELSLLRHSQVANLACPSATIREGLMGPQPRSGRLLPPQVARLKQMPGLKYVVVVIGPNDAEWSDLIKYCYGLPACDDNFMGSELSYRLAAFDNNYGDLLSELKVLPSHPQVIIVQSYDAMDPRTPTLYPNCPEVRGPSGVRGLTPEKVQVLLGANRQLNDVLAAGAGKYGFKVAAPQLTKLCEPSPDGLGPDIQGLADSDPFHPTATGSLRLASAVLQQLAA